MNVDEIAFKKGHRYITVISDRDGHALALTDDRGIESLASYLHTLTDGQLLAIKTLHGKRQRSTVLTLIYW